MYPLKSLSSLKTAFGIGKRSGYAAKGAFFVNRSHYNTAFALVQRRPPEVFIRKFPTFFVRVQDIVFGSPSAQQVAPISQPVRQRSCCSKTVLPGKSCNGPGAFHYEILSSAPGFSFFLPGGVSKCTGGPVPCPPLSHHTAALPATHLTKNVQYSVHRHGV